MTKRRNALSLTFTREAWKRLSGAYMKTDDRSLEDMQVGAYLAGLAIENSMLGAAHACANPLTKNYGIVHGIALAVLLPHVVRWNACPDYDEFHPDLAGVPAGDRLRCGSALVARRTRCTESRSAASFRRGGGAVDRPFQPSTDQRVGDLRVRLVVIFARIGSRLSRRLAAVPRQSAADRCHNRESCEEPPRIVDLRSAEMRWSHRLRSRVAQCM